MKKGIFIPIFLLFALVLGCVSQPPSQPTPIHIWNDKTKNNETYLIINTSEPIRFSIIYDQMGTISWYKDGVLGQVNTSVSEANFTTFWDTVGDKQVNVSIINSNGTSYTLWVIKVVPNPFNTTRLGNLIDEFINSEKTINIELTSKNYEKTLSLCQEIRYKINDIITEYEKLDPYVPSEDIKEKHDKSKLLFKSLDNFYNHIYLYIKDVILKYRDEQFTSISQAENYIYDIKSSLFPLERCLYYLYKAKKEYPHLWHVSDQSDFEKFAYRYKEINQLLNKLYDLYGGYYYKYTIQVNPNDPLIVEIVDEKTRGMTNQTQIKWILFNYVRENVNYTYDPAWETDWVQPPAYTLLYGYGDCEDHAILLASLFARAGISNVYILGVDTRGGNVANHAVVGVYRSGEFEIWDATYEGEGRWSGVTSWKILKAMPIEREGIIPTPTPTKTPTPTSYYSSILFSNNLYTVPAGGYRAIYIYIDIRGKIYNYITGNIIESAGYDINFYVFDETNYYYWKEGKSASAYVVGKRIKSQTFSFIPDHTGYYYFVFDNTFSIITNKAPVISATWYYR